jgi:hypothetical protein
VVLRCFTVSRGKSISGSVIVLISVTIYLLSCLRAIITLENTGDHPQSGQLGHYPVAAGGICDG